ncbi:hypothetical protein H6A11_08770, partial [Bifidobacterium pullorum subsp. saeculare]|uniref:DUF6712 family protein n=1 Tax=Bifidobacterium pullorum TaxID=78448 RepID=UPI00195674B8
MNKGLMQKNSDNSQPVSSDDVKLTRDRYKNRAEIFEARARAFLIENNTTYPEYYTGNTGLDDIQPNNYSFK